ncbi:MAG: hypothetical protein MI747_20775 [Desulfobacterales bacterium]|nr:hypothetical protein [Desulfobacterales bacterium]
MTRSIPGKWVLILFSLLFLGGCVGIRPKTDPAMDRQALARITQIRALNQEIQTTKGMGKIQLIQGSKSQSYKLAWAAQAPDKARIILTFSGQPLETIIADGEHVRFISHTGRHSPHTTPGPNPDLDSFLNVPVRLSQLIALLLGQIPVPEFDDAWFTHTDPATAPIGLKNNFSSQHWQITPNPQGKITKIELLDRNQNQVFFLEYQARKSFKEFQIPSRIHMGNHQGNEIFLTISRFFPNAPVKESAFRLTPTGS